MSERVQDGPGECAAYPRDTCIQQLFDEQVSRTPRAIAAVFEGVSLSYSELNVRANGLALRLRELGVGPDVIVGLCTERSLEMVVALVAILKAGGAYLPLDPRWPEERLAFVIGHAGASAILVQGRWRSILPEQFSAAASALTLLLEEVANLSSGPDAGASSDMSAPDDLAYVMYTSGTTGQPKGVMITHRGIIRTVVSPDYMSLCPDDAMLQYASLAFDASTFEIWGSLLSGGRLAIAPPGRLEYGRLQRLIAGEGVTILWLTAAVFHHVVEHAPEALTGIRQLLTGGDVILPDKVRRYLELPGHGRLICAYGPTENTTFTSCCGFDEPEEVGETMPIGYPINGTTVYIIDANGAQVTDGVSGEICTGGDGLARGYVNAPELTAERFLLDPFSDDASARMYRTGDVGYRRPDGNFEFLGRVDRQVKIRGFRIEPAEIEIVLSNHPALKTCAVMAEQPENGDKILVAFVVPREADAVTVGQLRSWLAERLPDHMIPSLFVGLTELPLTPNGKVDYRALESCEETVDLNDADYVAPRDELEARVAEAWKELLGRDQVGALDNFFEIGGNSLLAMQVVSRLSVELALAVPLRWIFDEPTVERLARVISSFRASDGTSTAIMKVDRNRPLLASFGQQSLWMLQQILSDPATYNETLTYRISGLIDRDRVRRSLVAILNRHEVLRSTLLWRDDMLVQCVAADASLPWEDIDLSLVAEEDREAVLSERLSLEARRVFDLENELNWRVVWLTLSDIDHVIELSFHHGIIDEWSMRLFARELQSLYLADGDATRAELPELCVQYADFAAWQRKLLSVASAEHRAYWKEQLADLPPPLDLAVNRAGPVRRSERGGLCAFELAPSIVAGLRKIARINSTTAFSVGLATFAVWLHRHTGRADIAVAAPFANRAPPETQSLIGFFLNTLPIRMHLDGDGTFADFLSKVCRTLAEAIRHSDLPYEHITSMTGGSRAVGQHVLNQVMFILVEEGVPKLQLEDSVWCPTMVEKGTCKADLSLYIDAIGDTWSCRLEYPTDLFSEDAVDAIAQQLCQLFQSVAAYPTPSIGRMPVMSEAEQQRVLVEWNRTERIYPEHKCLHQLFDEQVARTPDAVAAVCNGQSLTYSELDARSTRLACHLRSLGVEPDTLVGLCMARSLDMIIALFGILKAGGAYVPMDPKYPADRLGLIAEDSGFKVLVTARSVAVQLPGRNIVSVYMDDPLPDGAHRADADVTDPNHLAYVMYTSGSTGWPKGVAIEHRNVVAFVHWVREAFTDEELSGVLFSTSLCFDLSVFEVFGSLCWGGRIIIVDDVLELFSSQHRHDVKLLSTVPSLMQTVLTSNDLDALPSSVTTVSLIGEPLHAPLVDALYACPHVRRVNDLYGPAETTTCSTWAGRINSSTGSGTGPTIRMMRT